MINKKGLTIIELLVVILITAIVVGGTSIALASFLTSNQLDTYTDDMIQSLRKAQANSIMRVKDSQWGVYLDSTEGEFIFFKGSYYGEDPSYDLVYELPPTMWIESISLNGGGDEVVFEKVTGETSDYGTIEMRVERYDGYIITINSLGQIEKEKI